jgi:hypothetical protein
MLINRQGDIQFIAVKLGDDKPDLGKPSPKDPNAQLAPALPVDPKPAP